MLRYAIILLLPLAVEASPTSFAEITLKGELDGIPMHTINVETRHQREVDIVLDGRVDEATHGY